MGLAQDKVVVVTGAASGMGRAGAELFAAEGAAHVYVVDLDEAGEDVAGGLGAATFVRCDVSDPGEVTALFDRVVAEFGPEIVGADGQLDRPALGHLVFADDAARKRLEAIVHPLVFERYAELEASAPEGALVVHDIPLLAESGRASDFDAVIVVDASRETQVDRMTRDRGWSVEDAESRIAAQASREDRLAIATHVIDNTGTLEALRSRVEEIYRELTSTA